MRTATDKYLEAMAGNIAFLNLEDLKVLAEMLVKDYDFTVDQLQFFLSVAQQEAA